MADRYWVGSDDANWNDTNNWSTTSGGSGGAGVPTSSDNVYFNSNGGNDVTLDTDGNCNNLDASSAPSGFKIVPNAARNLNIYGDFINSSGTDYSALISNPAGTDCIILYFKGSSNQNLNGNGGTIKAKHIYIQNGKVTVTSNFTVDSNFVIESGAELDTNGYSISPYDSYDFCTFEVSGTWTLGSSVIEVAGFRDIQIKSGATLNAGTSEIKVVGGYFDIDDDQGVTFYNLTINEDICKILGSASTTSFNNVVINYASTSSYHLAVDGGKTIDVNSFTANGTDGSEIILESYDDGTQFTLNADSASVSYIKVKDCEATGTASPIDATTGGWDLGNNTGWTFEYNLSTSEVSAKLAGYTGTDTNSEIPAKTTGSQSSNDEIPGFLAGGHGRYIEDFSTTDKKDGATTASWTGDGSAEMDTS